MSAQKEQFIALLGNLFQLNQPEPLTCQALITIKKTLDQSPPAERSGFSGGYFTSPKTAESHAIRGFVLSVPAPR